MGLESDAYRIAASLDSQSEKETRRPNKAASQPSISP